jgi:hypothetical protein
MSPLAKWEYMKTVYERYHLLKTSKADKGRILDEFCKTYRCHRKHALRLLNGPKPGDARPARAPRTSPYADHRFLEILEATWAASGYLCGQRLKPAISLWLPAIRERFALSAQEEQLMLNISAPTIDRRLKPKKFVLRRRIYGATRPGLLLKHQIPIKTDSWDVDRPGFMEVDLVSHSGDCAEGLFAHTLNLTDIFTGWVERRCVLGKGQAGICQAIDDVRRELPFALLGLDSDNGSEFINAHLLKYCQTKPKIQFTRGRPYKKDDNAHIEQKNWTHVRKLLGYARYDTQQVLGAINNLYRGELRLFQNLFQPSVRLVTKTRVGSKLKRRYDAPATPLDRVTRHPLAIRDRSAQLVSARRQLDPFALSAAIESELNRIWLMRTKAPKPAWLSPSPLTRPPCYKRHPMSGPLHEPVAPSPFEHYERLSAREAFLAQGSN